MELMIKRIPCFFVGPYFCVPQKNGVVVENELN